MVNIRLHMAFTLLLIYSIKSTSTGFPKKGLEEGTGQPISSGRNKQD